MRRIALALLASTSLLGLASVAEAADLAVRKAPPPPPPPPLWSWTGFYIGAHVGAGWARNEFTTKDEFCLGDEFDGFGCENRDRGSHNAIGGLGGVQVGFNWQAGWVLFGIEGHGVREVASLLGLPEGTVKSRIHGARRRLLETLR